MTRTALPPWPVSILFKTGPMQLHPTCQSASPAAGLFLTLKGLVVHLEPLLISLPLHLGGGSGSS
jgi:hypothetical protein